MCWLHQLSLQAFHVPEGYLVRHTLSVLEKSPAKVSQTSSSHSRTTWWVCMCEREVSDMVLRKESEGTPFLFSPCMRVTLVSEEKSWDFLALPSVLQAAVRTRPFPKPDLRFSFSRSFKVSFLLICKEALCQIMQWGMMWLVVSLKRCGAERELAIQQGSTDWGALRIVSVFHSSPEILLLPEPDTKFSWQVGMSNPPPTCIWYVQPWGGGQAEKVDIWAYFHQEWGIWHGEKICKSHWANETCLSLWPLSSRKAVPNHKAQYSNVSPSHTSNSP